MDVYARIQAQYAAIAIHLHIYKFWMHYGIARYECIVCNSQIRIQTQNTFVLEAQVQVQYSAMHLQYI